MNKLTELSRSIENKIALITGATSGMGLATAKLFSEEGAQVIVTDLKQDKINEVVEDILSHGKKCFGIKLDVTDSEEIKSTINEIVKRFGGIDILINNAGIAESADISIDFEKWNDLFDRTIDVNLKAPSLIFKELIKYKRANKIKSRLRFINIASRAAFRGEQEDYISYACSKGGMISLTKTMSRSFGETDNIVAISIAPGFVRTEMAQSFIDKHGEDVVKQGITLDRLTEPKDISPLVLLIVSGKMDHSTGSTIDINGGSFLR